MALEQLKTMTVVVADTGDFESKLAIVSCLFYFQVNLSSQLK